jgi:hypothetical protein
LWVRSPSSYHTFAATTVTQKFRVSGRLLFNANSAIFQLFHGENMLISSSAVDRGFYPRLGQTKDYKIGICCFFAKHAALRSEIKHTSLTSLLHKSNNKINNDNVYFSFFFGLMLFVCPHFLLRQFVALG